MSTSTTPTTPAQAATARDILRRAMPSVKRFWPGAASGFLSEGSAVALLACSAWLIVFASEQPPVLFLGAAVVGVRAFALSRAAFRYTERLASHDAALRQLAVTRTDLVRRLIPLAPAGLAHTRRGSVLGALVDDVDELQNLPLRVALPLVSSAAVALGAVVLVGVVWWPAALTLLACLIVAALVATGWGWVSGSRAETSIAPLRAQLADAVNDHLGSLDVLVAYGAEPTARERIRSADAALRRAVLRRATAQAATTAIVSVLAGLASIFAVMVAAPAVGDGTLRAPAFAVAVLVPMAVFEVFTAVPLAAASWRQVRAAAHRIAASVPTAIPAELPAEADAPSEIAAPLGEGIRLRSVSARWPGATANALNDVDLDVHPGDRVLVVGSSGAGKSTLAHLLVRFLEPSAGSFTLGGTAVDELPADAIRRTIGLCEQQPMLFDEDIRQNLLFAHDSATDAELEAVLDRVGLRSWLHERGGLDARVGERGALVSGGQAQRIALARGILRGFPVLVLDEPTAGVDPDQSDALLRDLLGAVGSEQAVVLISHVSVPADLVDRTVRLSAGRVLP